MAILAAGLVTSAAIGAWGSYQQSKAAGKAAKDARKAGAEAQGIVAAAEQGARADIREGSGLARRELDRSMGLYGQQRDRLGGLYSGDIRAGDSARSRLEQVLLGGDIEALQMDPGYQFRLEQGNKAIQRMASAGGSLGSGANIMDTARFTQGLASQEYGSALQRLFSLQQVGAQAKSTYAGLDTSLAGSQAGVLADMANLNTSRGTALANIGLTTAANRANALTGTAATAGALEMERANAQANLANNLGNTVMQGAFLNYALQK